MTKFELEQCIKEYGRDIYSFCKQLTCNQQEADDLYQDTFLKALEQLEKLDRRDNSKSYLLSVAVHLWKNRRRKMAWRHRIAPSISFMEERDEEKRLVQSAVDKLPERLKVCVLLFYMEQLSVTQIAKVLKVPEGTVKSRLYQARKLLEKELESVL